MSGKTKIFQLRIPEKLHQAAHELAKRNYMSLNTYILNLINTEAKKEKDLLEMVGLVLLLNLFLQVTCVL